MTDHDALRRRLVEGSLIDTVQATAEQTPDAPALIGPAGRATYNELITASFGLAHLIADRLGTESEPVMLFLGQGNEAVTATLGVLAAGKYYVALDPDGPPGQATAVVASTGVRLVLTDRDHAAAARELTRADVVIVEMDEGRRSQVPPVDRIDPASPAYVYFTSGSTGAPKGVMDTHRNVLHNVFRYTATLGFGPADRMSLIQSPSVSAVVSTQFGALCNGAALCPVPVAGSEPGQVTTALADAGATIFHTVPALFHYLADFGLGAVASLRLIRLEGDRAASSDVDRLRSDFAEEVILVNGLGATECGLVSQFFVLPGQQVAPGVLPVGHAVPDVEVLVQDAGGALATGGAEGEVVIRSAFLASGYWGNAALTARRFREDANGNHLYFTGDIGRLTDSGELTLVGRVDDQVKIRGVSVHLGAVEDVILRQPGISGAMVEIDWGGAGPSLVAHVVGEPSGADDRQIQVAIFDALPAAAVPAIRRVERLPVTAAGKLDRSGRG